MGEFDEQELSYGWIHADPRVERLYEDVRTIIGAAQTSGLTRTQIFTQVWEGARRAGKDSPETVFSTDLLPARATIPYLTEPWFC